MNIYHNGSIFVLSYTEWGCNYGTNNSLYVFGDYKTAKSYMTKQVKDTLNRLNEIVGKKYKADWLKMNNNNMKKCGFGKTLHCEIDASNETDELIYIFDIRELPIRVNDQYENPDFANIFLDVSKNNYSYPIGKTYKMDCWDVGEGSKE